MTQNINRKGFSLLSNQQKICLVLAVWCVSAGFLLTLNRAPDPGFCVDPANLLQSVSLEKNHMGRCRFGLSDPADQQYLGTVSFESLKTSSADTGPFKTAALREMEIGQLKIDLTQPGRVLPAPETNAAPAVTAVPKTPDTQPSRRDSRHWSQTLMDKYLRHLDKQDLIQIALPDFSHLVQIRINDFECRFLEGQTAALHIQSKKASVQTDNNGGLLLRGHVIIRTPTATLESNNVLWDIQNNTFQAQGFYSIRTGNILEKGTDGLFGPQLNKITQQRTFASKGEKTK